MTPAYLLPPLRDQYAALLRGVAAAPDDDTPRLVLADWLEEHAGTVRVTCERCGSLGWIVYGSGLTPALKKVPCPDCEGEGSRLVSNGCGERAEFIRVQCELARLEAIGVDHCKALVADPGRDASEPDGHEKERIALRTRERELFDQVGGAWFALPGRTVVWGDTHTLTLRWEAPERDVPPIGAEVRRGFVDTVRGPLGALLGDTTEYGALERMGPELLAVREAVPTDKEPYWNGSGYTLYRASRPRPSDAVPESAVLPDEVFDIIPRTPFGTRYMQWDDPKLASEPVSQAVLALARRRAGLEGAGAPS